MKTKSSNWFKKPRWLTLKTERQLKLEAEEAKEHRRILEKPSGIRSFIEDEQKKVDTLRATTESFIRDIEKHFGEYAKYLNPEYTGRAKYVNVEKGKNRRVGVKWVERIDTFENCIDTSISFAYTETLDGVRLDYILNRASGLKTGVINDDYSEETDEIYKNQSVETDFFRSVRRYDSHDDFVNSGDHPPKWFLAELSKRTPSY